MGDLNIDSRGYLKLPAELARILGEASLQAVSVSSGHLFLARPQDPDPVLIAGVLEAGAIPDLLSYFNMFRKTGILNIELSGGSKALYFQQGEIVFATSTFASEDLGEVLFSLGKVEREPLDKLRSLASPQVPLGKLLVERGAVAPKDLWLAARSQVENIVYNLFAAEAGGFSFRARAIDQEQILRLSMSTQNMIMEGLRRLDEKALFMRKIVSLDYYPMETGQEAVDLAQSEVRLISLARNGQDSARTIFRKAGLREFDGMRILYGLLEKGLLRMEDAPTTEVEGELGQVLAAYNSLFRALFTKVAPRVPHFSREAADVLRNLPQPYSFVMRDVELQEDGTLDGYRMVANLVGLEEGDKKKLLADSLCEMAFMETMIVRRELAAEEARPLISRVQDVTTRVREWVGRNE